MAFSIGTKSDRLVAEQEAAGMDREVAREVEDLVASRADDVHRLSGSRPAVGSASAGTRLVSGQEFATRSEPVSGKPKALPTSRTAERGAIADDVGDHRRVLAAVLRVDVLDDLLAPVVLDVEIDVGRLGALPREEALEEQTHAHGIDRGDAQAVADGRVRRGAAPLAEDPFRGRSGRSPTSSGSSRDNRGLR